MSYLNSDGLLQPKHPRGLIKASFFSYISTVSMDPVSRRQTPWSECTNAFMLNLSAWQTQTNTNANNVDQDETEPSHLDLHGLLFGSRCFTDITVCNNGCVQIQRWIIQFQKLRGAWHKTLFALYALCWHLRDVLNTGDAVLPFVNNSL